MGHSTNVLGLRVNTSFKWKTFFITSHYLNYYADFTFFFLLTRNYLYYLCFFKYNDIFLKSNMLFSAIKISTTIMGLPNIKIYFYDRNYFRLCKNFVIQMSKDVQSIYANQEIIKREKISNSWLFLSRKDRKYAFQQYIKRYINAWKKNLTKRNVNLGIMQKNYKLHSLFQSSLLPRKLKLSAKQRKRILIHYALRKNINRRRLSFSPACFSRVVQRINIDPRRRLRKPRFSSFRPRRKKFHKRIIRPTDPEHPQFVRPVGWSFRPRPTILPSRLLNRRENRQLFVELLKSHRLYPDHKFGSHYFFFKKKDPFSIVFKNTKYTYWAKAYASLDLDLFLLKSRIIDPVKRKPEYIELYTKDIHEKFRPSNVLRNTIMQRRKDGLSLISTFYPFALRKFLLPKLSKYSQYLVNQKNKYIQELRTTSDDKTFFKKKFFRILKKKARKKRYELLQNYFNWNYVYQLAASDVKVKRLAYLTRYKKLHYKKGILYRFYKYIYRKIFYTYFFIKTADNKVSMNTKFLFIFFYLFYSRALRKHLENASADTYSSPLLVALLRNYDISDNYVQSDNSDISLEEETIPSFEKNQINKNGHFIYLFGAFVGLWRTYSLYTDNKSVMEWMKLFKFFFLRLRNWIWARICFTNFKKQMHNNYLGLRIILLRKLQILLSKFNFPGVDKLNHTNILIYPNHSQTFSGQLLLYYTKWKLQRKFTLNQIIYPFMRYLQRNSIYMRGFFFKGSGRFTRKQRADLKKYNFGQIRFSTYKENVVYYYDTIITPYGKCGLKLWYNLDKNLIKKKYNKIYKVNLI